MRFENKVGVVTGAAMGMGYAFAAALAAEGAAVAVVDVNTERAAEAVEQITASGGNAQAIIADVSKAADAERIARETVAAFGGIDYVVNNAGVQTYGTVVTTDEETWDRTLDINLKGAYLVSHYCIPEIEKRGSGAVVNIASIQGLQCQPNVAAYAASKGGMIAMTRSMAQDHAPTIRVNCVCPGSVDTPLLRWGAQQFSGGLPADEAIHQWTQNDPIPRAGRPEEIARTVLFLLSDDSSFTTGAVFVVDGGHMAAL
ncbi:MAG: glucose 1-dehydrogenase [Anaerolineae bacterium]|nr:glucose 1-dehydrogenase [Anaerolineae bacterium]